jgi:hypothetical protein
MMMMMMPGPLPKPHTATMHVAFALPLRGLPPAPCIFPVRSVPARCYVLPSYTLAWSQYMHAVYPKTCRRLTCALCCSSLPLLPAILAPNTVTKTHCRCCLTCALCCVNHRQAHRSCSTLPHPCQERPRTLLCAPRYTHGVFFADMPAPHLCSSRHSPPFLCHQPVSCTQHCYEHCLLTCAFCCLDHCPCYQPLASLQHCHKHMLPPHLRALLPQSPPGSPRPSHLHPLLTAAPTAKTAHCHTIAAPLQQRVRCHCRGCLHTPASSLPGAYQHAAVFVAIRLHGDSTQFRAQTCLHLQHTLPPHLRALLP